MHRATVGQERSIITPRDDLSTLESRGLYCDQRFLTPFSHAEQFF